MVPNGSKGKKVKSKHALWYISHLRRIKMQFNKHITLESPEDQWGFKTDYP